MRRSLILWPRSWFERIIAALGGICFFIDPAWYGMGPTPLSVRFGAALVGFLLSWLLAAVTYRGYHLVRNVYRRT
jgi:hypothetical protein